MITITTETKRFTLKTDSDQSDKLFKEMIWNKKEDDFYNGNIKIFYTKKCKN